MCGIAGIMRRSPGRLEVLKGMGVRIAHRGPDDRGFLWWDGVSRPSAARNLGGEGIVGLAHRRLAILDLSPAGWQPMADAAGRYHVVYNGEIYNYVELRAELQELGHEFRTQCDTEVLIAAWATWGERALGRLIGMFAFAILDVARREVVLARDPFGIKPLYCSDTGDGLVFASEIKALLHVPGVTRDVAPQPLYDYMRFGLTDHGEATMFASIRQLPPAHYMVVPVDDPRAVRPVRYWEPTLSGSLDIGAREAASHLRKLFLTSVEMHLRSDMQVGVALSGGIDSSAIAMSMRRVGGRSFDLRAFGYVAEGYADSEEAWIEMVAGASGASLTKVTSSAGGLAAGLDALVSTQDEPFGSTSIHAQHCVFAAARRDGIAVMLDGQGADELLAGYRPYLAVRLSELLRAGRLAEALSFARNARRLPGNDFLGFFLRTFAEFVPQGWSAGARRLVGEGLMPSWMASEWFERNGVLGREQLPAKGGRGRLVDRLLASLQTTVLPALLRYEDRNSMAFSVESRVPFLVPAIAEFLLSLPSERLIDGQGTTKAVFRDCMRGIVPDAVLDRRDKIGFSTPQESWLKDLAPWIQKTIGSPAASAIPAFDHVAVQRLWQDRLSRRKPLDATLWRWVNLIRWAEINQVRF